MSVLDLDSISLRDIPAILPRLSLLEQEKLLAELEKLEELKAKKLAETRFLAFVKQMWPSFIGGRHHAKMADAFERVARGECKRLIINMPPRHTKSEFASYLFPAWFLGKYPGKKVIQTSHTAELAVGFGRKVRNLVDTEHYHKVFPDLVLQADSKAAGRWNTSKGGDYFAIGVGGAVTGKGADCAYFSCKVLTKRGIVPISEARVGDYVYGYDHKQGRGRWARVLAGSTQRKPELVQLGGVVCTPEHRVFTPGGYERADGAYSVAVSDLSGVVHEGAEGVLPRRAASGKDAPRGKDLLFIRVQPYNYAPEGMRVWEPESTARFGVQGVLPAGEDRAHDMHGLQQALPAEGFRTREEYGQAWGDGERLLLKEVLYDPPHEYPPRRSAPYGAVPDVQYPGCQQQEVLLDEMLRGSESPGRGVYRQMVASEAYGEEAGQGRVRAVRPDEAESGSPPYKPYSNRQPDGELYNPVRAVPRPLPYTDCGSCADDYSDLLTGAGHWVVDIQTDTQNFYVWGPDADINTPALLMHNCLIIDDPHSEQEAALAETNPDIYDKTYEWYTSGPRQRLQPGGAIVVVMTRWSKRDLTSQVLKAAAQRGGDEWEVIEFPAILPSGNPLWPEFWPMEELQVLKEELPNSKWMAQYQQNPTGDYSAIIKREWWQLWDSEDAPQCEFILQSWDTAFEKTQRADYSACTTWGVFYQPDDAGEQQANIILLNAFRERMEFPRLKQAAIDEYKEWEPDSVIIEKKASGAPLIYEMRAMGIPVQDFTPTRGNDKISRLNAVSDLFASGRVWAPATHWAEEVIDEVASFPGAEHDDYTDTVSMALMRFRKGGYITTNLDEPDDIVYFKSRKHQGYY